MRRHIVLIGLPGSGKSVVGQVVAERLQAAFVDLDALIVRKAGRPIALIFAEQGEAAFRTLETREMDAAVEQDAAVIAPGGGWAAHPGNLDRVRPRCWLVYLKARPETAAQRAPADGSRPLLSGGDPVVRMRELLRQREASYRTADAEVETDRKSAATVAAEVVRLAQSRGGW